MDLTGEYRIPASREDVWDALNNENVLRQCISGCEELSKISEAEFSAKVTAKVGPVRAKFVGKVYLSDIDPPTGYTISGEGQGGVAGFAKGGASVKLTSSGDETILTYMAKAEVGGKLASVGSRLVEGVAKKTADDFFGKFCEIVGGGGHIQDAQNMTDQENVDSASGPIPELDNKQGLPLYVWAAGIIVVVGAILYLVAG